MSQDFVRKIVNEDSNTNPTTIATKPLDLILHADNDIHYRKNDLTYGQIVNQDNFNQQAKISTPIDTTPHQQTNNLSNDIIKLIQNTFPNTNITYQQPVYLDSKASWQGLSTYPDDITILVESVNQVLISNDQLAMLPSPNFDNVDTLLVINGKLFAKQTIGQPSTTIPSGTNPQTLFLLIDGTDLESSIQQSFGTLTAGKTMVTSSITSPNPEFYMNGVIKTISDGSIRVWGLSSSNFNGDLTGEISVQVLSESTLPSGGQYILGYIPITIEITYKS